MSERADGLIIYQSSKQGFVDEPNMSSKHFRKRRRKRGRKRSERAINKFNQIYHHTKRQRIALSSVMCLPPSSITPILLVILLIFPTRLHGQLMLQHPKTRVTDHLGLQSEGHAQSPSSTFGASKYASTPTIFSNNNIDFRETKFPEESSKRNDMLRKLSSTMLLETLLRKPVIYNKSTFPPLTLESLVPNPSEGRSGNNELSTGEHLRNEFKKIKVAHSNSDKRLGIGQKSPTYMEVSTTNITNSVTSPEQTQNVPRKSDSAQELKSSPDKLFNPKSLNYLVQKLLDMSPIKSSVAQSERQQSNNWPMRPIQRPKSPYEVKLADNQGDTWRAMDSEQKSGVVNALKPAVTLDMLIRSEYDQRTEPLVKTLNEQRNLSTSNPSRSTVGLKTTTTKLVPMNHRFDPENSYEETTTMLEPAFKNLTSNSPSVGKTLTESIMMSPAQKSDVTSEDSNGDEYEDGGEEDDLSTTSEVDEEQEPSSGRDHVSSPTTSAPSSRKIFRNVPPYQLSPNSRVDSATREPNSENHYSGSTPKTTSSPPESVIAASSVSSGRTRLNSSESNSLGGDASPGKGSLVFSDGEEEAANRRRNERNNSDNKPRTTSIGSSNKPNETNGAGLTKSDKLGDNFLLNQLFSTVNPLNFAKGASGGYSREQADNSVENPLIYKGYVGRDDYLISTTASDWSRHIGNNRSASSSLGHHHGRFAHPSGVLPIITTTSAPPTEPPTVPYNYYLHQPVTNAQSVPEMVIPTSDPLDVPNFRMPTTMSPKIAANSASNQKQPASNSRANWRPAYGGGASSHEQQPPDKVSPVIMNAKKYSYQIHDQAGHNSGSSNANRASGIQHSHRPVPVTNVSKERPSESDTTSSMLNATRSSWLPKKVSSHGGNETARQPTNATTFGPNTRTGQVRDKSQSTVLGNRQSGMEDGGLNRTMTAEDDEEADDNSVPGVQQVTSGLSDKQATGSRGDNRTRLVVTGEFGTDEGSEEDSETDEPPPRETNHTKPRKSVVRVRVQEKILPPPVLSASPPKIGGEQTRDQTIMTTASLAANKTRSKKIQFINHEPAGSEISTAELDERFAQRPFDGANTGTLADLGSAARLPKIGSRNSSKTFTQFHQPTRSTESILIGANDQLDQNVVLPDLAVAPNPNFFGEASSERPVMDNTVGMMNHAMQTNKIAQRQPSAPPQDPYQKTSSNQILSTILQPLSTTAAPFSTTLSGLRSSTTRATHAKETVDEASVSTNTNPTTKSSTTKSSSDRLAFILIGGSCVLSVVCLVLAAMSMRCQDMCDDYQSLRNAEKAALKLQKHRLKYMKSHQVNRFNGANGLGSAGTGQNLLEDLQTDIVKRQFPESDNGRNLRQQLAMGNLNNPNTSGNNKSVLFQNNVCKSNHQNGNFHNMALSSQLANGQICACETCTSRQLLAHDELVTAGAGAAGSKHFSWLHPYFHLQGHPRLRPLFGAGSSVGTFFPKRHDNNHSLPASSSLDAQADAEHQHHHHHHHHNNHHQATGHACTHGLVAPQGLPMTHSKSILSKNNSRLANGIFEPVCSIAGVHECGLAEHSHAHHVCHHDQHNLNHKCHHHNNQTNEVSLSDESGLTFDDGRGDTCAGKYHCAGDHQHVNNRMKLTHLAKLNSQLSSGWRKQLSHDLARGTTNDQRDATFQREHVRLNGANQQHHSGHHHHDNHHMHHHHHNHQQQSTSSEQSSSPVQCTCSREQQPLIGASRHHKRSHHDHKPALGKHVKRDKQSMLVWSTNRDRLI